MFVDKIKKGDSVFLINAKDIFTLELNENYIVYDIKNEKIALEGDKIENDYRYYHIDRFKKNIKKERKLKLEKLKRKIDSKNLIKKYNI